MAFISEDIIEDIRLQNEITEVVSQYVNLEKKGRYLFGLCPFHKEKTPSFSVTPSRQIFYCYSCQRGGNVFQFIKEVEGLSYIDSVKLLADRAGILLPEDGKDDDQIQLKKRQTLLNMNTDIARFFHENLNGEVGEIAREYLINRGLDRKTLRKFGIGYATDKWDDLTQYLRSKNYDESLLVDTGVIIKDKNGKLFDRFRNRVMFPIFDVRGNVLAFGGRVIDESLPKYINSSETPVYVKGRHLYGLNFVKTSGIKKIIVVEGYMDVISLHQRGIINAVASLGTALTREQGKLLKMYSDEVIIAFDADTAGQAATMRGLDILSDAGCNLKVLEIPKGKDPDEFIKANGVESFRNLISNSLNLVEYKIKVLRKQLNSDKTEDKIKFLNEVAGILSKVENNIEREMYLKKISREYQVREEALLGETFKKMTPGKFKETKFLDIPEKRTKLTGGDKKVGRLHEYEKMVLALLVENNSLYKQFNHKIKPEYFSVPEYQKIAESLAKRLNEKSKIDTAEFLGWLEGESLSEFSRLIEEEIPSLDNVEKAFVDIINKIEYLKLDSRKAEILEQLKEELEDDEKEKLKADLQSILLKIRSL